MRTKIDNVDSINRIFLNSCFLSPELIDGNRMTRGIVDRILNGRSNGADRIQMDRI
jgi:hypothetical protein